ncbi:hypothetical protein [Serratia phage vB_SspM_LC53]|nr:hypothetical protein [Serratia phage vB_SspM_LC53]
MNIFTKNYYVFFTNKINQDHMLSVKCIGSMLNDKQQLDTLSPEVVKALVTLNQLPLSERDNMFYEGDGVWNDESGTDKFKIPARMGSGQTLQLQQLIECGAPDSFLEYISEHLSSQSVDKVRMHHWAKQNKIPAPVFVRSSKIFFKVIKEVSSMAEGIKFLGLRAYNYSLMAYNDASSDFIKEDDSGFSSESLYGAWFEVRIDNKVFRFAMCVNIFDFESARGSYSDKNRTWFIDDLSAKMKSFRDHDKGVNILAIDEFVKMCRTKHTEVNNG